MSPERRSVAQSLEEGPALRPTPARASTKRRAGPSGLRTENRQDSRSVRVFSMRARRATESVKRVQVEVRNSSGLSTCRISGLTLSPFDHFRSRPFPWRGISLPVHEKRSLRCLRHLTHASRPTHHPDSGDGLSGDIASGAGPGPAGSWDCLIPATISRSGSLGIDPLLISGQTRLEKAYLC